MRITSLAPAGVLLAFAAYAFSQAVLRTPCCADDAFFAIVARGLAETGRYGLPLWDGVFSEFERWIGSGPALILPLAALFELFGVIAWLPGLATILLYTVPLAVALTLLAREFGAARTVLFLAAALALLIPLLRYQPWLLFSFLGEMPAAAWVILGTVLLLTGRAGLAGLCFSLAFLTKQIALMSIAGIVAAWAIGGWREHKAASLKSILTILAVAAVPVALFELWKVLTFGPLGYIDYLGRLLQATSEIAISERTGRIATFRSILADRYFVDALVVSLAIVSLTIAWRSRLAVLLWCGAAVHMLYILSLSTMTERYFSTGVVLAIFATAAPLLAIPREALLPAVAGVASFVFFSTVPALRAMTETTVTADVRERETVLALLNGELASYPIRSAVWQTIFDTALLLRRGRAWSMNPFPKSLDDCRPCAVVMNKNFIATDHDFLKRAEGCERRHDGPFFLLAVCRF